VGPLAAAALAVLAAAPSDPAAGAPPLALTVSGAVSLGSYEAGLLHYLVESLRLAPGARELRLVTGASAGSANGLLAVLQHCGEAPASPQESLFWRSWIDVGIQDFHLPYEATPVAAFSRRALYQQAERIEEAWRRGLRASCDVVVGISATRVAPRLVAMAPERLLLPRIDEQFTVRVQGRGPGRPPRLTNYVDPAWGGEQLLLPEGDDGEVPFLALRDLLLASVAFPAAFPPQPLAHCVARGGAPARCPATEAVSDLFLDGGLLDNTPLRSAVRLARAGLIADAGGGAAWAATPRLGAGGLPDGLLFAYVSPTVIGYPAEDEPPRTDQPAMIEHVTRVASSFVEAAFAKNLLVLVEEDPAIGARVAVPVRSLPAAGSPLAAFFGFLEEEFRAFDFQLGMYEARRMLASGAGRFAPRALPEDAGPEGPWRPLRCLRAVLDGAGDPAAACAGDELADFRILLQASLERLWDRCAPENGGDPGPAQPLCGGAWRRAPMPVVPGVRPLREPPRQRRSESHVAYVLRLLVGHGFWFRDHGLSRERTREAPAVLRRELIAIGRTVSAQQPLADGVILDALAAMAADAIVYVPPRNSVWVVLGRDVELGASHGFFDAFEEGRWFRLHAAVQLNQLGQAISSDPGPWAVTLLAGAELLPPRISSTRAQLGALLRGGWQLSSRDRFGKVACPVPETDTIGVCSRPVLQAGAVGALLERVRLHVVAAWYPRYDSMRRALWAVSPAAGLEWAF
jgi:predicted acylesterase/phospholipase RssA